MRRSHGGLRFGMAVSPGLLELCGSSVYRYTGGCSLVDGLPKPSHRKISGLHVVFELRYSSLPLVKGLWRKFGVCGRMVGGDTKPATLPNTIHTRHRPPRLSRHYANQGLS